MAELIPIAVPRVVEQVTVTLTAEEVALIHRALGTVAFGYGLYRDFRNFCREHNLEYAPEEE